MNESGSVVILINQEKTDFELLSIVVIKPKYYADSGQVSPPPE